MNIAKATMTLGIEPILTPFISVGPRDENTNEKSKTIHYTFYLFPRTNVDDRDVAVQMFNEKEGTEGKTDLPFLTKGSKES